MNGPRLWPILGALALASVLSPQRASAQDGTAAVVVEPGELTKRAALVGREVQVDDRVSRFQYHRETGFDQIFLTRAPEVAFDLPSRLRPAQSPSVVAVKIRGTLHHDGERWWVDVSDYETQPADLDRLNRAVALLPRADTEARTSWARWAEQRGHAFKDAALLKRAKEIERDAIQAESDKPPGVDPSAFWLSLAERARSRDVPEPEPSAQAHRGFRAALGGKKSAEDLKTVCARIESFFPAAKNPLPEAIDLSRWERPYTNAPADAYRAAPAGARQALDHRLWADATQQLLEKRASESPKILIGLADEAARLLPDRPGLASGFLEKGLTSAETDVGSLRLSEVESLAALYREKLHQPEKARELFHAWLNDQKDHRLSPRDAEGRIALAEQYETLLDDRATAVALLRDALSIDPDSREVADAFRRRNFRKVKGEWVELDRAQPSNPQSEPVPVASANSSAVAPESAEPARARSDSIRGATPDEVRSRMGGRPNRKVRVASQGQLIDQWIYFGPRLNQYVTFLRRPGESQPRVVSYYSLPRAAGDPSTAP